MTWRRLNTSSAKSRSSAGIRTGSTKRPRPLSASAAGQIQAWMYLVFIVLTEENTRRTNEAGDACTRGTKGHTQADLPCALAHGVCEQAVDSDDSQEKGDGGKEGQQRGLEAALLSNASSELGSPGAPSLHETAMKATYGNGSFHAGVHTRPKRLKPERWSCGCDLYLLRGRVAPRFET